MKLNEFEGDDAARMKIITLLRKISDSSHVKVCLSSRPWLIFADTFKSRPSLLLQQWTYNGIKNYVQIELVDSERFVKLKTKDPSGCAELASSIVEKAEAVVFSCNSRSHARPSERGRSMRSAEKARIDPS